MAEISITPDMSLNDVIRKYPNTIGVFNRFNIDSCCGGARSIRDMAAEDKVDLGAFMQALKEAAEKAA
jgi:regulator of cell morphogenesis and NO signaling